MIYSERIDGKFLNYVPDKAAPEFQLKVCLCSNWKCWKCAGSGMYWEHESDFRRAMSPTFKEWHSLTPDQKKVKSESFWVLVDGWWEPRATTPQTAAASPPPLHGMSSPASS